MKHIIEEGSRNHVIRYSTEFRERCSEPDCEINNKYRKMTKEINFQVNCRDCGKPMKRASELLQTTIFCGDCKLKATVIFEKQLIARIG